ncbi:hypothetical protein EIB18_17795 [Caulobacter vibrioides]|nr:hypothetical protein EIB18_17795 [Caulobacter vibrioides]
MSHQRPQRLEGYSLVGLPPGCGGSHPYISRRDDRRADQVTQGRRCASPRRGRRRRSLTDLISPARCSLQET